MRVSLHCFNLYASFGVWFDDVLYALSSLRSNLLVRVSISSSIDALSYSLSNITRTHSILIISPSLLYVCMSIFNESERHVREIFTPTLRALAFLSLRAVYLAVAVAATAKPADYFHSNNNNKTK